MSSRPYNGLAREYEAFVEAMSSYYVPAHEALKRLLGPGGGLCVDIACGGGHFLISAAELGWQLVGIDESVDQLGVARVRQPAARFVVADAARLPFADSSFDAAFSTFTHTDLDDFATTMREDSSRNHTLLPIMLEGACKGEVRALF